jgi:hypothetical protein
VDQNQALLTIGLLGMGAYFAVLIVRSLRSYWRFRSVQKTALVTWPIPRPPNLGLLLGLGVLAAFVAALNGAMARPWHNVLSQALVAVYFILVVPLSLRIQWGCYANGVWADGGFLPYGEIRRLSFREVGAIVLVLVPRRGAVPFRMLVPPSAYGAVRRVLEDKARAHELQLERVLES